MALFLLKEWKGAENFSIKYEIDPGNNIPSPHLTDVFVTYSKTDLYVGFIAYADMENLRSSIRNRINTVYTRAVNKPLLSTKIISQGENQRFYWLTAFDEASPYLIAGENRSYFGEGKAALFKYFQIPAKL